MRKVIFPFIMAVLLAVTAFANAMVHRGFYLWDAGTQSYVKYNQPPFPEKVEMTCWGDLYDCYYVLDETGTIKSCIAFRTF